MNQLKDYAEIFEKTVSTPSYNLQKKSKHFDLNQKFNSNKYIIKYFNLHYTYNYL